MDLVSLTSDTLLNDCKTYGRPEEVKLVAKGADRERTGERRGGVQEGRPEGKGGRVTLP